MIRPSSLMANMRPAAPVALGLALLAGCEFPTEAPILEQRWIVPAEDISISVAELLPADVQVVGANFQVDVPSFSVSETLGDACPICIDSGGITVPAPPGIPAFSTLLSVGEDLPADVASAALASGSITFTITNGLGFDPIAGGGHVILTLKNGPGGATLGTVAWDSDLGDALTAGANTKILNLAPGTLTGFAIDADVVSVGGQSAPIDTSASFTVAAVPSPMLVSSVTVTVPSKTVDFDPVSLDVEDIDTGITDNIVAGGINFVVQNPFGVTIVANLDINHPGGTVQKLLNVSAAASSTSALTYTGDEFRSFLGQPGVTFSGSGTANAGSVTLTPTQELIMRAELDLTVEVGG